MSDRTGMVMLSFNSAYLNGSSDQATRGLNSTSSQPDQPALTWSFQSVDNMTLDLPNLSSLDNVAGENVSFDNLYSAICQCFTIILVGYIAGRVGIISKVQGDGIAAFISKFCLPSLLFINMCELPLKSVNWMFLLGIFISKAAVFALVALVTLVAKRPHNLGYAGIFAIFATQSNDFALGYPIVQALYGQTQPGFVQYIYLIAPISLALLNPIGFTLMEIHKHHSIQGQEEQERMTMVQVAWNVFKGIVTNPIIFMTVIGIVGNFVFGGSVPDILKDILNVLGQAYSAGALFYLGLSMVGKIRAQLGLSLVLPIVLIAAKSILLPLVSWEVIDWLEPAENGTSSYSMYGFLYGTIPTAPTLVLYAAHFDVAQDIIATGLVLGTFLSAPLMFVSAKMMTVIVNSDTNYSKLLHETAFDVSIISLISGVWVFGIFFISGKWQRIPHRFTMSLLFANVLANLGIILYHAFGENSINGWHFYPIITLMLAGVFSARCWTAVVSLVLCLLRVRSLCFVMRIQMWLYFAGFGLPIVMTGLIFLIGSHDHDNEIGPSFHYGNLQTIVSLVILLCSLVVSITAIVYWQRVERHLSHAITSVQYTHLQNEQGVGPLQSRSNVPSPTDCDQGAEFSTTSESNNTTNQEMNKIVQDGRLRQAASIEDLMTNNPNYRTLDTSSNNSNSLMENVSERTCLLGKCSAEQRHTCMDKLRSYAATVNVDDSSPHEEEPKTEQEVQSEEYQTNHHLVLLLMLLLSVFFGLFLCTWKLLHKHISGIYVEVEFLDIVFNYGQGFFVLAVFGFDTKLVFSPLMRRLRRLIYGAEVLKLPKLTDLDSETTHTCQQFVDYHKENCVKEIVKDRRFRFKTFREVFTGTSLCDWLLRAGLVSSREGGVEYGQHLLLGRVITHISGEFNFHDMPHFYKFIDKYERLDC